MLPSLVPLVSEQVSACSGGCVPRGRIRSYSFLTIRSVAGQRSFPREMPVLRSSGMRRGAPDKTLEGLGSGHGRDEDLPWARAKRVALGERSDLYK